MEIEMRARMRSSAPVRSESRSSSHVNQISTPPTGTVSDRCWICKSKDGHWTDQCQDFIAKPQPERLKLAQENHACFSCLKRAGRDHRMNTCRKRQLCTESYKGQPCKFFHHPLLHPEQEGNQVSVAAVGSSESVLPILKAEFIGAQQEIKEGNVLLDSGAQISIVRQGFAEALNLKGTDTTVNITKVGGETEQLQTKTYKVPVCAVNGKRVHTVSAVGLPCITEEIPEIDVSRVVKKVGLSSNDIFRGNGEVDLLIGINHGKMHVGETRQYGDIIFRKSPIGWVVFGGSGANEQSSYRLLNVRIAPTVNSSDVSSTEATGVQTTASGCECQHVNMSKAEKDESDIISHSGEKVDNQCRQVKGDENTADVVSRRVPVQELSEKQRDGPELLKMPKDMKENLPSSEMSTQGAESEIDKERRKVNHVKKFIHNVKVRHTKVSGRIDNELKGPLSLKEAQKTLHVRSKHTEYKNLNPYVKNGTIYVGGRAGKGFVS